MWCRVIGIGKAAAFGKTQDEELVLIPKCRSTYGVEIGDIVAFDKAPPFRSNRPHLLGEVKFFAKNPHVIAQKLTEPERKARVNRYAKEHLLAGETRHDLDAVEWKQEQERRADADGLREVCTRAGDSGLGAARASDQ